MCLQIAQCFGEPGGVSPRISFVSGMALAAGAVTERLQGACARAFASEEFTKAAERLNVNAELVVGSDFAKRLDDERREMKVLIETLDLKVQ